MTPNKDGLGSGTTTMVQSPVVKDIEDVFKEAEKTRADGDATIVKIHTRRRNKVDEGNGGRI